MKKVLPFFWVFFFCLGGGIKKNFQFIEHLFFPPASKLLPFCKLNNSLTDKLSKTLFNENFTFWLSLKDPLSSKVEKIEIVTRSSLDWHNSQELFCFETKKTKRFFSDHLFGVRLSAQLSPRRFFLKLQKRIFGVNNWCHYNRRDVFILKPKKKKSFQIISFGVSIIAERFLFCSYLAEQKKKEVVSGSSIWCEHNHHRYVKILSFYAFFMLKFVIFASFDATWKRFVIQTM